MRPNSGSAVISLRSVNPFPLLRGKVAPQPVERRSSNALWGRMGKIERSEMAPNVRHVARSLRALNGAPRSRLAPLAPPSSGRASHVHLPPQGGKEERRANRVPQTRKAIAHRAVHP